VCWYIGNRLAASTALDATRAQQLTSRANQTSMLFEPFPTPRCQQLAQHDGVLVRARYSDRAVEAVIYLTRCGILPLTSADSEFAQQLPQLTGLPTYVDFQSH